jgi:hypothetical protein
MFEGILAIKRATEGERRKGLARSQWPFVEVSYN